MSVVLVVALGTLTFRSSAAAESRAEAVHRADAARAEEMLARLTTQYLLIGAKEAADAASSLGFSLQPGDPADRGLLQDFVSRSAMYDYGAALVRLDGQPINAFSRGPLPPASDAGYASLRAALLARQPGLSSVMHVGGVAVVAIAVPVVSNGTPRALLVGYWRADSSKLQTYNEQLREEASSQDYLVDDRGTIITARDRSRIGTLLRNPAVNGPRVRRGVQQFRRDGVAMTSVVSPVQFGRWTLVKEVPTAEFYGAIRDSHRKVILALAALLSVAAAGLILLNHRSERSRRRQEERFRSLVQNAADVITVIGIDGRIVYESPGVERVLGYAPDERVGELGVSFVHPDQVAWVEGVFRDLVSSPVPHARSEVMVRRRDGSYCWSEVTFTNMLDDPAVKGVVANWRDISERVELHERLAHQAFHDPLTGLPNRALFHERLRQALVRRRPGRVAVLFCDLDRFKIINDSLGHEGGDQLLVSVARRLDGLVRDEDTVARISGDEFVVLLDGVDEAGATQVAERIIETLRTPFSVAGKELAVGVSIGIAWAEAGKCAEDLLRDADLAMYRAKQGGRLCYEVFAPDMSARARERLELEAELRHAVEHGGLEVHYQPEVELGTGRVTGIEALVRWRHPTRGLLLPAQFVPIAEETGLIVPLGTWVLRQACRDARRWRDLHPEAGLRVSVNVSGRQLKHGRFVESVADALRETGLPPEALVLELTESMLVDDTEATIITLRDLTELGLELAIDDFGTGYSSLSYLKHFPISSLKLDRSFVLGLGDDRVDAAIAEAVIGLAHSLGMVVVAEGVEMADQLSRLRDMQCERGQGFLFAHPMPADEVSVLLAAPAHSVVTSS